MRVWPVSSCSSRANRSRSRSSALMSMRCSSISRCDLRLLSSLSRLLSTETRASSRLLSPTRAATGKAQRTLAATRNWNTTSRCDTGASGSAGLPISARISTLPASAMNSVVSPVPTSPVPEGGYQDRRREQNEQGVMEGRSGRGNPQDHRGDHQDVRRLEGHRAACASRRDRTSAQTAL